MKMKVVLFYWAVTVSLTLVLVLMLKLHPPCTATAEEIRSAEIACDGEIGHWMDSYNSIYSNFKLCSVELNFALGLDTNPQ
ncbi:hypothetical protein LCGC14_2302660 [marine sediment metagenome]|uniref:Uncharacterized protein n=1 Tax=marine sediment metagenome TaxID=412755 RepID=A0A0F9CNG8_9ZZZZ